jgi:hypothetical protein
MNTEWRSFFDTNRVELLMEYSTKVIGFLEEMVIHDVDELTEMVDEYDDEGGTIRFRSNCGYSFHITLDEIPHILYLHDYNPYVNASVHSGEKIEFDEEEFEDLRDILISKFDIRRKIA